jgi:hypothetical protein
MYLVDHGIKKAYDSKFNADESSEVNMSLVVP